MHQFCGGSSDFSKLVTVWDNVAILWDGQDGRELATLPPGLGKYMHVEFDDAGNHFIIEDQSIKQLPGTRFHESRVSLWSVGTGEKIADLPRDKSRYVLDFLPDGKGFMTTSSDSQVQVWPIDILAACKKIVSRPLTDIEKRFYLGE